MSVEDKFKAAVNVIRSLPKSGSYQPSNEMLLRFYSYYKQATDGPCDKSKPGFWDVVNRAKWESWNKLGNMTKEEAMEAYVHELHRIVETMSYTDNVASFMAAGNGSHDEIPGFPSDDLELVAGDIMEKVRSKHNTPISSREVSRTPSPNRSPSPAYNHIPSSNRTANSSIVNGTGRVDRETTTGHESDDEFKDTIEQTDEDSQSDIQPGVRQIVQNTNHLIPNGHTHKHEGNHITNNKHYDNAAVLEELRVALQRLERDMSALRQAIEGDKLASSRRLRPSWWPFKEISPALFTFIVVWPFVAHRITRSFTKDK